MLTPHELERIAYINGDSKTRELALQLIDAEDELEYEKRANDEERESLLAANEAEDLRDAVGILTKALSRIVNERGLSKDHLIEIARKALEDAE